MIGSTNLSPRTCGHATLSSRDLRLPALFTWIGGADGTRTRILLGCKPSVQPIELLPRGECGGILTHFGHDPDLKIFECLTIQSHTQIGCESPRRHAHARPRTTSSDGKVYQPHCFSLCTDSGTRTHTEISYPLVSETSTAANYVMSA